MKTHSNLFNGGQIRMACASGLGVTGVQLRGCGIDHTGLVRGHGENRDEKVRDDPQEVGFAFPSGWPVGYE